MVLKGRSMLNWAKNQELQLIINFVGDCSKRIENFGRSLSEFRTYFFHRQFDLHCSSKQITKYYEMKQGINFFACHHHLDKAQDLLLFREFVRRTKRSKRRTVNGQISIKAANL